MPQLIQILLVSKDGKGGLINHPAQFGYPEKKMVAEKWFYNTGRYTTANGAKSAVFTEEGFNLNLDDFADPKEEEEKVESAVLAELEGILGEDSIFTPMIIEWHNRHLDDWVTQ